MESGHDPLLSICIPTYNRAYILEKTLETYIRDDAFDSRVEIIISDNCSTDDTQEIVQKFISLCDRIHYYRNSENISDLNFIKALSLGKGEYLKLLNDTVTFKQGALKAILDQLSLKSGKIESLFFYQNISFLNSDKEVTASNLNDLISNTSFYIGWIANFGLWKKDFDVAWDVKKLLDSHFTQVELTIRLLNRNKSVCLSFGDYYNVAELNRKGDYNLFRTFGVDYLKIYDEYILAGTLSKRVFRTEKFRLFRYFLYGWYNKLLIDTDDKFTFERNDAFSSMIRSYKFSLYFYLGMILLFCRRLFKI